MASKIDDDEYVANLLKQDAKIAAKTYALVGIDAFNPKRQKSGAPKPNTSFLRHIIRQTDNHNAALLAKEAEESNARLRMMNQEKQRETHKKDEIRRKKADGRLTPVLSDEDASQRSSRRKREHDRDETRYDARPRGRERERVKEPSSTRRRDESKDRQRHKRRHERKEEDRSARKRRHRHSSEEDDDKPHKRRGTHRSHRIHRSYSASRSRSRSSSRSHLYHSSNYEKSRKHGDQSRTIRRARTNSESRQRSSDNVNKSRTSNQRSASPASESDPLEALVGPLPHSIQPTVRARGRGAYKASTMGMDSRFATGYNPAADVRLDSDAEDDWGDALEALRDRQRWKQQGADRLKAAGFTDEQVKKWEKGDSQNEDDVIWAKKGQAREWDRGKVIDEDGDVKLKANFGQSQ